MDRHDPSLPYLEQYRIDFEQFKGMFALLFPWACGTHSDVLASRLFQLLDENGDSLINFREFVSGLSKDVMLLHELGQGEGGIGGPRGSLCRPQDHSPARFRRQGLQDREAHFKVCKLTVKFVFS